MNLNALFSIDDWESRNIVGRAGGHIFSREWAGSFLFSSAETRADARYEVVE